MAKPVESAEPRVVVNYTLHPRQGLGTIDNILQPPGFQLKKPLEFRLRSREEWVADIESYLYGFGPTATEAVVALAESVLIRYHNLNNIPEERMHPWAKDFIQELRAVINFTP